MKIESKAMRNSARGQQCTFNLPGVCDYGTETTVLCHLPDESGGMGRKSDDLSAGYGCAGCHAVIDGRSPYYFQDGEKDWYMRRAQTRTLRIMAESGVIAIKGVK